MTDEELIHEIAVELNNDGAYCGGCDYEGGLTCPECKQVCESYARNVVLPRIKAARAFVDRAAVDAALRQVIAHADYDLLKSLEGDESGVDEIPEYADRFIVEYGKARES